MSSSEAVSCYRCAFFKRVCSACQALEVERARNGVLDWAISLTDSGKLVSAMSEADRVGLAQAVAEYRRIAGGVA